MSDERYHPSPGGRPAATIWDHYRGVRLVLFVISACVAVVLFIPAMLGPFLWIAHYVAGGNSADLQIREHLPFALLFFIHSFLIAGLTDGFFGTKRLAFRISLGVAALWMVEVGVFAYGYRSVRGFGELMNAGTVLAGMILFVTGLSVFFIFYLLWHTNTNP